MSITTTAAPPVSAPEIGLTLTFGDCAENHVGMQIIGERAMSGFDAADLQAAAEYFTALGKRTELVDLDAVFTGDITRDSTSSASVDAAQVLVIRGALDASEQEALLAEMLALSWDTKARMRGRVVNKHARHNLCFDAESAEPNYAEGRGRVVGFDECPILAKLRTETVANMMRSGATADLKVEGNLYYDVRVCGIGFHGDSERRKVVGMRIGTCGFPLMFQWYHEGERVGPMTRIDLLPGDMYVMTEKATGCDWKRRKVPTLRHAAGCNKYTK